MEGDAGTGRLTPTDDSIDEADQVVTEAPADSAPESEEAFQDRPSRLSRGWFAAMFVLLLVLAAGVGTGGYLRAAVA